MLLIVTFVDSDVNDQGAFLSDNRSFTVLLQKGDNPFNYAIYFAIVVIYR